MNTLERAEQRYIDQLSFWLRMREVPGEQIGDIVAEAQAHVAVSGETLREACGPPYRYARRWGPAPRSWWRVAPAGIAGLVGGLALAGGAWALGRGEPALFGLPAGWTALAGLVVLLAVTALGRYDPVRDPRTGSAPAPARGWWLLATAAFWPVLGVAVFLLGRLMSAL